MLIGTEHEYSINGPGMVPLPESDRILEALSGPGASAAPFGSVTLAKELQKTVIEVIPAHPAPRIHDLEVMVAAGVAAFCARFGHQYTLLGLGMHPALSLSQTRVWDGDEQEYYAVYDRIFGLSQHGWLNIQALQLNLGYADDRELVAIFNRLRALLPYLAAISAASPFVEGVPAGAMDNRLQYYRENQRQIPAICNRIVPEELGSRAGYDDWLDRMYRDLRAAGGAALCNEWVASFGVIVRFSRRCIELKVMDEQECVRSDMALAAFVRALVRADLPFLSTDRDDLLLLLEQAITHGTGELRPELLRLWHAAERSATPDERPYLPLVRERIEQGSIAELLMDRWKEDRDLPGIMEDMAGSLRTNIPYAAPRS
jgi:gamma-glutamyl:cysteine ligase YbdK (ATP-grasp superfamily)